MLLQGAVRILAYVSETRDKRRRNDLDLFVLALLNEGIATPYELKQAAGLSPGATIPVLRRLVERGMVSVGKPGPRGRTGHRITAEGRRFLKTGWRELIDDGPSGDLDADLRVALLALVVGNDRRLAQDFLKQSAARKLEGISNREEVELDTSLPPLAHWYRRLRSTSVKALVHGEASAALAMAKALPRTKPAQPKKSHTKSAS